MKKAFTAICCMCLAYLGYLITTNGNSSSASQNAIHAATIPYTDVRGQLPLDLQLDLGKTLKSDTVYIHDTITIKGKTKYVRIPVPGATDTIYVPLDSLPEVECVSTKRLGTREELSNEEEARPSPSIVILSVDGRVVYDNSKSASDEPQKL